MYDKNKPKEEQLSFERKLYHDISERREPDTVFVNYLLVLDSGDNEYGFSKIALLDSGGDKVHVFVLPKKELDKLNG